MKKASVETKQRRRKIGQIREAWRRMVHNKKAVGAMIVLAILLFIVIFADFISPYSKGTELDVINRLIAPCKEYWFGTDAYGRDLFTRIIHGSRMSLLMGFGATFISATIGTLIGTTSAYLGGRTDSIIMRLLDMWMAIPSLLVTLAIIAGVGVGIPQMIGALAFGGIPGFARVLRASALGVVNQEFIESARALGAKSSRIVVKYIIPNVMSQFLVQSTMNVSGTILLGATLSFLGLGAQPPTPEWGAMLSEGLANYQFHPYLVTIPGVFLAITALAINIFGDALRDALDPKLKGRA